MKVKKIVSFIAAVAMMTSALSCNVSAQDVEDNRYDTEYGMSVRDMYCTGAIDGAVEITDEDIKNFFYEIDRGRNPFNGGLICRDCDIEENKLYAFDTVKYDNSTAEGRQYNSELLNKTPLYYLTCSPVAFEIYVEHTGNEDRADRLSYLDETYKLTDNSLALNYVENVESYVDENDEVKALDRINISGFHYLTKDLAEQICLDLQEKGYYVSSKFESAALSDYKYSYRKYYNVEYPEKAAEDIKKIVSESGITAEIVPCTYNEDYFTINYPDVENTTQMDVVKLRVNIYKTTGLRGTGDSPDYIPVADRTENMTGDVDSNGNIDVSETSIDSNFSGDRLIAVIKGQYSSDGKVWEPEFFGVEGITEVEDLSYSPEDKVNNRQILLLKFAKDDKQQILDAVSKISEMEEIEYAGVNGISAYDKPEPVAPAMVYVDTNSIKYSIGDINNDEKVDVTDLSVLALALIGENRLESVNRSSADIDGNGKINLADLARLKQYIVIPDQYALRDADQYSVAEVRAFNEKDIISPEHDFTHNYKHDLSIVDDGIETYADVIESYEEFKEYVDVTKLPEDAALKYTEEYFTNNTLIVYLDCLLARSTDLFVLDATITDEEIALRTYQRDNGLEYQTCDARPVFVDVPNELYKGQKMTYSVERMKYLF